MTINRRRFLTFGAAGLGGAALLGARQARAATSGLPVLKAPEPSAELHIGCQQMLVPGKTFEERSCFVNHERLHLGVKPFRCRFDLDCPFSSLKRTAVRRHVRQKHFRLPKTLKQQAALNIVDTRDPDMFIEEDVQQMSSLVASAKV